MITERGEIWPRAEDYAIFMATHGFKVRARRLRRRRRDLKYAPLCLPRQLSALLAWV